MRLFPVLEALIFSSVLSMTVLAQEPATATRDDGRKILLYPDGTWRLLQDTSGAPSSASTTNAPGITGAKTASKPQDATLFVKAAKGPFGVWVNPDKWRQDPLGDSPDPIKITLSNVKGDAYAMVISERISVPADSLTKIAVENAKNVAPDIHIVLEENRVVNGKNVKCLQMEGTTQGVAFTYYGYYYGGSEGTLQVVTYTGTNLFAEFKQDFEDLLNGTQIGQ
jgi:hypothetical protein